MPFHSTQPQKALNSGTVSTGLASRLHDLIGR